MKKLSLIILLISFFLISCSGYNNVMYKELSNIENYVSVTGTVKEIYFIDEDGNKTVWISSTDEVPDIEYEMYISMQFINKNSYLLFSGGNIPEDFDFTSDYFRFHIVSPNVDILINNGFFDEISIDDDISILTSNMIYMDTNFFEIILLEYNNYVYLDSDSGFNNFVTYMENNKSLF